MKRIEQIRNEYSCPLCKSKRCLSFQNESAHCNEHNVDFDLGMKKFEWKKIILEILSIISAIDFILIHKL